MRLGRAFVLLSALAIAAMTEVVAPGGVAGGAGATFTPLPELSSGPASPAPSAVRPILAPPLEEPEGPPPHLEIDRPPDAVAQERGVRLELWVPQEPVASGEWLPATLRVTNRGTAPVRHLGDVDDPICKSPVRATLLQRDLFDPGETWTDDADLLKRRILRGSPLDLAMGVWSPEDAFGCADFGVVQRLEPGGSFTVPVATWPRYSMRDQPVPGGTARVRAMYQFKPSGSVADHDWIVLRATAGVRITGGPATFPSPHVLVDAALRHPEFADWLESVDRISRGSSRLDWIRAPRGYTFAGLGYTGGPAPDETVRLSIQGYCESTPLCWAQVHIDPWAATVERVSIQ